MKLEHTSFSSSSNLFMYRRVMAILPRMIENDAGCRRAANFQKKYLVSQFRRFSFLCDVSGHALKSGHWKKAGNRVVKSVKLIGMTTKKPKKKKVNQLDASERWSPSRNKRSV